MRALILAVSVIALTGCAESGGYSRAFVTPRKYDHLECKQLTTALTQIKTQVAQSDGLYDKGGAGLGFLVYGPDLVRLRGEQSVLEQAIAEKGCEPG
ncbi:MAG: hypothetical protein QOD74_426 [Variibacter sp.]|nr:hypothetical protein [Variibacter sp.]